MYKKLLQTSVLALALTATAFFGQVRAQKVPFFPFPPPSELGEHRWEERPPLIGESPTDKIRDNLAKALADLKSDIRVMDGLVGGMLTDEAATVTVVETLSDKSNPNRRTVIERSRSSTAALKSLQSQPVSLSAK